MKDNFHPINTHIKASRSEKLPLIARFKELIWGLRVRTLDAGCAGSVAHIVPLPRENITAEEEHIDWLVIARPNYASHAWGFDQRAVFRSAVEKLYRGSAQGYSVFGIDCLEHDRGRVVAVCVGMAVCGVAQAIAVDFVEYIASTVRVFEAVRIDSTADAVNRSG